MTANTPRVAPIGPVRPDRLPFGALVTVLAAVSALVAATIWGQATSETSPAWLTVDICCGVLAVALMPALFRYPVPVAVLLAALAGVAAPVTPPATIATLTVAQRRPLRTAVLVGAAGVLGHAVRGWWRPTEGLSYTWWLVLDVAAHAALVGIGALLRAHSALVASLRARAVAAEAEQGRLIAEARAAERHRMAREMHDVLAHRLSLLATHAGALEYRPDAPPERIARSAGVVREGVHEALQDLRQVISVLRTDDTDDTDTAVGTGDAGGQRRPQPVLTDVPALAEQTRQAGTVVDVVDHVTQGSLPPAAVGRTAYRIVQEALTNARKHAPGCPVTVRLQGAPGQGLTIEVVNPLATATATAPLPGSGTGLVGLTERARLAGGRLDHHPVNGQFRLVAWLPWPE